MPDEATVRINGFFEKEGLKPPTKAQMVWLKRLETGALGPNETQYILICMMKGVDPVSPRDYAGFPDRIE